MLDIRIREYEPSDLEQCRTLWEELTHHHRHIYDDPSIGGDAPGLYFDEYCNRTGLEKIWVVEHESTVIGLSGLIIQDAEAEVEPVVIKENYRNQGIGRALVNHIIQEAKKRNIRYLNVNPVARNVDALSFFHRQGFQTVGHIQLFIDLEDSETWKSGIEIFDRSFKY
ncbi:MAG: GNAT family N-acetyltransferase [Candidatus Thorarchaeota archaeon]|jgi:N-acetylglutamate synthase-like GNAT family acetyltransferase